MFKKLALGCFVLILLVLGAGYFFVSSFPTEMNVTATRVINAPTADIHAQIEDLHKWPDWSFWDAADPTLTYEYSGADKGVGAIVNWVGKDGPGSMTVTASDPEKGFWYDLAFGEPGQEMSSKGVVLYEPVDGGTQVTFEMRGDLEGFLGQLMGWIMTPMVTEAFKANLENIAGIVEAK